MQLGCWLVAFPVLVVGLPSISALPSLVDEVCDGALADMLSAGFTQPSCAHVPESKDGSDALLALSHSFVRLIDLSKEMG